MANKYDSKLTQKELSAYTRKFKRMDQPEFIYFNELQDHLEYERLRKHGSNAMTVREELTINIKTIILLIDKGNESKHTILETSRIAKQLSGADKHMKEAK